MTALPVEVHYGRADLVAVVLDALAAGGHDVEHLDPEALTTIEEFHTLGRTATRALAEAVGLKGADAVLDVGSGIGGPARYLARTYGCHVTGIDLTPEFCALARELNRRTSLDALVEIHEGDATALPFPDASFDVAWTQHTSMNIADKARFYAELRRVLRPGGRLASFDIAAGSGLPLHFPVPWAEDETISFLATPDDTRQLLTGTGFEITRWEELGDEALAFFRALADRPPPSPDTTGPTQPGLPLLVPNIAEKAGNVARNLSEGRIGVLRVVARIAG